MRHPYLANRPEGPPVLLLDLDTPLAAFDEQLFTRCAEAGFPMDVEHPRLQRHRYSTDHLIDPAHEAEVQAWIDQPGWFRTFNVVDGAQEGVAFLEAEGVDVWVCTKPKESNPMCHSDKMAWVKEHFPSLTDKLIVTPNKAMTVGDVLLDDAPKLEWFPRATWQPVIFATPWNGEGSRWAGLPRWSWESDPDELLAHLTPWRP